VAAVLAAAAVPVGIQAVERSRAWAATRYLAGKAAEARIQAVRRAANVALRFEEAGGDVTFSVAVDGNRNGVRAQDIQTGADPLLEAPARLGDLFPGVRIALGEDAGGGDSVRFGSSGLLSFTPLGTSSSGTVYIRGRDGSQFAVRVFGATGRTRVLQYRPESGQWIESF
jgi:hypothetical protein